MSKDLIQEAEKLTSKYRAPTSADVTELLGKKVTDELLASSKGAKQLDLDQL